jgi:hypothetical protein
MKDDLAEEEGEVLGEAARLDELLLAGRREAQVDEVARDRLER